MAQRFTLLGEHPRGILDRAERDAGDRTVKDLQIDRAFRIICPDSMYREDFLSVLRTPLTDPDEIRERQRILRIFHETPAFLDKLIEVVRRILLTKNMWDSERSRLMASRRVNPQDKNLVLWVARENLVLTAHFLKIFLSAAEELYECLNMFPSGEGWLLRLRGEAYRIAKTPDTDRMTEFASKLERGLSLAHSYDVELDVSEEMRIGAPFLSGFDFVPMTKKPDKPTGAAGLFAFLTRDRKNKNASEEVAAPIPEEGMPERHAPVDGVDLEWGQDISARAVQECDRLFTSFLRTLTDRFAGMEEELYFYRCAVMYINRFEDRGIRYVWPEILPEEKNSLSFRNLSDLLLLTESMHVYSVIPNDVDFRKPEEGEGLAGMLVTGKNNSGKTVYLRSIGTAVLLAQCGLPVSAEAAEISVRRKIFTTFARAEGELVPLSSAGRFEEEVSEIAAIIKAMEPDSLLLLNETFQTTAYDEGADGMGPILEYLASLGCGFIFVTHLTRLVERYRGGGGVTVMRTSDDPRTRYKIAKI
jgi:DNA mismatch repair ATPase MutS